MFFEKHMFFQNPGLLKAPFIVYIYSIYMYTIYIYIYNWILLEALEALSGYKTKKQAPYIYIYTSLW